MLYKVTCLMLIDPYVELEIAGTGATVFETLEDSSLAYDLKLELLRQDKKCLSGSWVSLGRIYKKSMAQSGVEVRKAGSKKSQTYRPNWDHRHKTFGAFASTNRFAFKHHNQEVVSSSNINPSDIEEAVVTNNWFAVDKKIAFIKMYSSLTSAIANVNSGRYGNDTKRLKHLEALRRHLMAEDYYNFQQEFFKCPVIARTRSNASPKNCIVDNPTFEDNIETYWKGTEF